MPDPQQQVNALIAGEIDLIEQPPHDLLPVLKKDKNVAAGRLEPARPRQFIIRFNHLAKPFDNPKIRQAALLRDPPGGLPQGDGRRSGVLQGLHRRLHLRHAQRLGRPRATC